MAVCGERVDVDGSKIFVDSSLIQADASNNSVVDTESLRKYLNESYKELERRLERDSEDKEKDDQDKSGGVNSRYISATDPDAAIVRTSGKAKLRYQTHRAVDSAYEVITATEVTPGDVNEAHMMFWLIDSHQQDTETWLETVVADSKYGTIENYLGCYDRGIRAHIPDLKGAQSDSGSRAEIFSDDRFIYDKDSDTYICPAGKGIRAEDISDKAPEHRICCFKEGLWGMCFKGGVYTEQDREDAKETSETRGA